VLYLSWPWKIERGLLAGQWTSAACCQLPFPVHVFASRVITPTAPRDCTCQTKARALNGHRPSRPVELGQARMMPGESHGRWLLFAADLNRSFHFAPRVGPPLPVASPTATHTTSIVFTCGHRVVSAFSFSHRTSFEVATCYTNTLRSCTFDSADT